MKRIWRSYLAFAPMPARVILFGIVPVLILGLMLWSGGNPGLLHALIAAELVLGAGVIVDGWCFGGIASKAVGFPEYVKSAPRGTRFLKNAMQVNIVMPLFLVIVTLLIGAGILAVLGDPDQIDAIQLQRILATIFAMETIYVIANTISRFFDSIWTNILISYLAIMLLGGFTAILPWNTALLLVIGLISMLVAVAVHWQIMKKCMEDSYYDV